MMGTLTIARLKNTSNGLLGLRDTQGKLVPVLSQLVAFMVIPDEAKQNRSVLGPRKQRHKGPYVHQREFEVSCRKQCFRFVIDTLHSEMKNQLARRR